MVGANIVTSLLTAQIIQYLWGIINSLQLIVLTVLFSIEIPHTCYDVLIKIMKMTNLDLIETEGAINKMFDFRETEPFNDRLLDAGYGSSNFFHESGALFFMVLGFLLWVPIAKCLQYLGNKT